jgi:hypothetical protein
MHIVEIKLLRCKIDVLTTYLVEVMSPTLINPNAMDGSAEQVMH